MSIRNQLRATVLEHHLFSKGDRIVVGVSGGPDSLALLYILLDMSTELETRLHVAHLNHRLRGAESEADAAFVAESARALGLPSTIEARDISHYRHEHHLSLEEGARAVRYQFLADVAEQVGADAVAVGHNADDQVETVVMHWLRGAGLAGLSGMKYKSLIPFPTSGNERTRSPLVLVRPLLDVKRSEIEAFCRERGLVPRLDESNLDMGLLRNRLRLEVIPYLEQINPNLREVLTHSARAIADDHEFLSLLAERAFAQIQVPDLGPPPPANLARFVFDLGKWRSLSPSLQRATLREAVKRLRQGLRNVNWVHIEEARRVACEKGVGAEATLPQGLALVVGYNDLTIGETVSFPDVPLLHAERIELQAGAILELPGSKWEARVGEESHFGGSGQCSAVSGIQGGRWSAQFDADKLRGGLILRTRRPGDRFEPIGLGGRHKSLHELMIEEKVPRHVRDLLPILADEEKILWVCGYRVDERAKVTDQTKRRLSVDLFKSYDPG
jgi:tRNA(Ile)-lysidine synthase